MKTQSIPAPLIALERVTYRAGGVDTFNELSLAVRPGELWVVAGPTGSGKSLFLAALAGQVPVSGGELLYRVLPGEAQVDYPEGAIGLVSPAQHRTLASQALDFLQARWSPREGSDAPSVQSLLREAAPGATIARARGALRKAGAQHLLHRDLAALSNGEFRRVLFARALLPRPRVLLLDDPFAGLDAASSAHLGEVIAAYRARGNAMVIAVPRAGDLPPGPSHLITLDACHVRYCGAFDAKRFTRAACAPVALPKSSPPTTTAYTVRHPLKPGVPVVDMADIHVRYGRVHALRGITWCIRPGEKWALRGPNGAGKTTLTNLILADHPQGYSNALRLFGVQRGSGESIWEIKRRIGWMAPELQYVFPGDVHAFDVVCSGLHDALGLRATPSRGERARAWHWLRFFGAATFARREFGALSDGQQRLVLLARALVKQPPLLILDEPSQGLDEAHRTLLHRAINALARLPQLTLLLITHLEEDLPRGLTHELRLEGGVAKVNGPRLTQAAR